MPVFFIGTKNLVRDSSSKLKLNENESKILRSYLGFKNAAQRIGSCLVDDVDKLQEENLKLQQRLFIYEIDQNTGQTCRRCGNEFMKSNKEVSFLWFVIMQDRCTHHPGDLRFFSCTGCGGDEYFNCCRKCSKCSKGCRVGIHLPYPRAFAEI
jgi:hypothetical protein